MFTSVNDFLNEWKLEAAVEATPSMEVLFALSEELLFLSIPFPSCYLGPVFLSSLLE